MVDQTPQFDAVIPFHAKDLEVLPYCIMGLRTNVSGLRNIYVISKDEPDDIDDIIWICEDRFPFTKLGVQYLIKSTNGREGWYFQQLLKMYVFDVLDDVLPHVLLFDADCVVCRPITFFSEGGQMLIDSSESQNHAAYFEHATKVLGASFEQIDPTLCGITDHMLVYKPHMEEILRKIGEIHPGHEVWQALLQAVDPAQKNLSGMSEYEIYFNYVFKWYPDQYKLRKLERGAGTTFRALTEASQLVDIIAFHAWAVDLHKSEIVSSRTGGVA